MFGLKLVTPPIVEPVSLLTAKNQLRVDINDDDALIGGYITAARLYCERYTRRAFFDQTWQLSLDAFPYYRGGSTLPTRAREDWFANSWLYDQIAIRLPKPSCVSVNSITYLDQSGVLQTLSPSAYYVDVNSEPARIVPTSGTYWPYTSGFVPGSVTVQYVAGSYGDGVTVNNCPQNICLAIQLLVGSWYTNRESVVDATVKNAPLPVNALLDTERLMVFGFGNN